MVFKTTKKQASTLTGLTLMLICTTVILLLISSNPTESRYLPTRADETDVEVLKNIIRGLLNQQQQLSGTEDLLLNGIGKHNRQQNDRQCYHPLPVPLEKRSREIPLMGNGGDPDTRLPSRVM